MIVVFLDCTIRPSDTDNRIFLDNRSHFGEKFRAFDKDPMSKEFYSLPSGFLRSISLSLYHLSKWAEKIGWV
ncbi:hypothetical protein RHGRI_028131 [Rhododendron griersonianum]|uniref:NADH-plastoquinone oxidoreductase subunit K n=1 Tax=Rhododendron griersonianum TaxID=479676 RepID=A0AAV6IIG3_9ERIC|nr:hypothetical protein RHGRI_028131 [Rhododendron griersonianum]